MHINSTVIAAGQGIRPPVKPNNKICQLVTSLPSKRRLMSLAWARAWHPDTRHVRDGDDVHGRGDLRDRGDDAHVPP